MDPNSWMIFMNNCQLLLNMHKMKRQQKQISSEETGGDTLTMTGRDPIGGRGKLPLVSELEEAEYEDLKIYNVPKIEITHEPPLYKPSEPTQAEMTPHQTIPYVEMTSYPDIVSTESTTHLDQSLVEGEVSQKQISDECPPFLPQSLCHGVTTRRVRSVSDTIFGLHESEYTNLCYEGDESGCDELSLLERGSDDEDEDDSTDDEQTELLVDACMQTSGDWEHMLRSLSKNTLVNNTLNKQLQSTIGKSKARKIQRDQEVFELKEMPLLPMWKCGQGFSNDAYDKSSLSSPVNPDVTIITSDDLLCVELVDHKPNQSTHTGKVKTETSNIGFSAAESLTAGRSAKRQGNLERMLTISDYRVRLSASVVEQTAESRWQRIRSINLEQEGMILKYNELDNSGIRDVAFAQGREPLNLINYHFKTKILSIGSEGYIGIGLTEKGYPSYEMPGWRDTSIAYHADDGKLYTGNNQELSFGPTLKTGDEIGVGLLFSQDWLTIEHHKLCSHNNSSGKTTPNIIHAFTNHHQLTDHRRKSDMKVFVTLNGALLGVYCTEMNTVELYPTIGLLSEGAVVKVDLYPVLPCKW